MPMFFDLTTLYFSVEETKTPKKQFLVLLLFRKNECHQMIKKLYILTEHQSFFR
jgi:hypothetical protein